MKKLTRILTSAFMTGFVAITSACIPGNYSPKTNTERPQQDSEETLRARHGCVGIGYSPRTKSVHLARTSAIARSKEDYVKKCLNKSEANVGLATENPIRTELEITEDGRFKAITYKLEAQL